MLSIIIIEIENPGNLGAIARAMKNFGFEDLVLINPKCSPNSQEAKNRAKHAQDVLKKAKVKKSSYLRQFDYLIATTANLGTDYNVPRSPITPEELAEKLAGIDAFKSKEKIGLVIGREGPGLTNEEIKMCDFVVTIPSSKEYPTLNVSHALAVMLYALSFKNPTKKVSSHIKTASKVEKEIILKHMNNILDKLEFPLESKNQTQKMIWKRIFGKSFLTKREAFAVIGCLKKIEGKMKK